MTEKTILITGSTDGIGKQAALEMADRGLGVILHGKNSAKVQSVKDEIIRF